MKRFPKFKGLSLTGDALKKNDTHLAPESEGSKRSYVKQGAEIMSLKAKKQLPQELLAYVEDYIEEHMRPVIERVSTEAAERVFEERFSQIQKGPLAPSEGYLPAPPMPETVEGTRRHTIPRGKLAGTVDSSLLELFESERKERGFTVSRMLDVVLWTYFSIGRSEPPKLSFERSESS